MGPAARLCSGLLFVFLLGLHHSSGFWIINVVFPPNAKSIIPSNSTPPLIIVPGNLGNRLEAKIDKPTLVHWMCYKKTEHWFPLWIDLNMFMPVGVDCWIDNIRLVYNKTTRQSSNSPGVQVRVPGFGQTYPIEFIDYNRLADENAEYLSKLHELVEEMYEEYQKPVFLLAHSMGCHYVLYFLNHQPQAWKDKYIRGFISLAAPWGGAVKILRALSSGENDGIPMISIIKIREEQRMKPTNPWILPTKAWPSDHVLISTPTINYTNQDYQRLFTDINYEDGWHMWEDTKNLTGDLYPPGVEVWCMYGVGLPTPVTYIYDEEFPNKDPVDFVYADGDDTVDSFSMSLCKQWAEQQEQPVHVTEYRGLPHLDIVFHEKVITQVQQIMEGQSDVPKEIDVRYGAE
ncbi:phosphatidylcholine-sterol acyltransferase-like isoform X2 [Gymnodraco acuticeps]|uniref:Phosphatidylcholine-sterol acyltransferase n=1 Tax=Gymnodraco acuticeps TaxID=8218 RepID=A0A6P8TTX2_GYMAC|nr:phosphatidylcholine-sterol acyltransferase-like isoform X2 [Gymnodraco acuticeps]